MKYHIALEPVLRIETINTCSLFRGDHPYDYHREFHPFWEIIYVTEGELRIACQERIYAMKAGDLLLHRPMEMHRLWSVKGKSFQILVVGFCAGGPLLSQVENTAFVLSPQQQEEANALIQILRKNFPDTQPQFLRYAAEDPKKYAARLQLFASALEVFLISLLYKPELPQPKARSYSRSEQLYSQIVQELNSSPDGWTTARQIADKLHYSESKIKQTFAQYSSIGIHKYLLNLKIAAAIQLLQEGHSAGETSQRLGFSNQNYFSTVFKRETGLPPSVYIKAHKQQG